MMHATTLLRQSLPMPPMAPGTRRWATSSTPVWYTSLCRKVVQQHPTEDTLHKQVNYKPKQQAKRKHGPKRAVAYTHRMWTATRQDLAGHTRTHFHLTMGAHRLNQWLTKMLNAWRIAMLGFQFWFRHSVARTSFARREQLAHPLLQLHSYAHSYLPTLSLHGQLYEVYTRQVRTIGGATPHRLLALLTGVLCVCLICSRLFL